MIRAFEDTVRRNGDGVFFRFADANDEGHRGREVAVTYAQARLNAIALMHQMAREGVRRGGYVASDMDNCPAFVYLILACWYGGFKLITLNHRLKEQEKDERLATVEDAFGIPPVLLTESDVHEMIGISSQHETVRELIHSAQRAAALSFQPDQSIIMFTSGTTGRAKGAQLSASNIHDSAVAFNGLLGGGAGMLWQVCLPLYH
ncbi:MAG: class I adenylate-forming enzyme family protein, partial [Coriobacteriia bacterium]|nr:class I adenylate-forming enzyme family protein [Coriobacteriia bacterium]